MILMSHSIKQFAGAGGLVKPGKSMSISYRAAMKALYLKIYKKNSARTKKYLIPINQVIGHNDPKLRALGNDHTDPQHFPWDKFRECDVDATLNGRVEQKYTTPESEDVWDFVC